MLYTQREREKRREGDIDREYINALISVREPGPLELVKSTALQCKKGEVANNRLLLLLH